ncbi:hypothetical protein AX760_23525 [Pararhizobium antarcticum]|uniref:Uncharacterized protein n=1 Tax=Pararhizobium antarcticum TaxID=1798805 RepID=A0A657LLP4_9HYPH|nr:hypothetical protein AX760_23525 [Pararhizobium antarcticum]OJF94912.1 hypothetical protein AX761_04685 [Rhizobium sp. 58]
MSGTFHVAQPFLTFAKRGLPCTDVIQQVVVAATAYFREKASQTPRPSPGCESLQHHTAR